MGSVGFFVTYGGGNGYDELYQWDNTYNPRIGFTFGVHPEGKIIPPNLQITCYKATPGSLTFSESIDYYLLYNGGGKLYIPKLYLLKYIAVTHSS